MEVSTPETSCMKEILLLLSIYAKNSSVVTRLENLVRLFGYKNGTCENWALPINLVSRFSLLYGRGWSRFALVHVRNWHHM